MSEESKFVPKTNLYFGDFAYLKELKEGDCWVGSFTCIIEGNKVEISL